MAAHRYWRIYVNAVHAGASVVATREIELRETGGGPDVTSGGTASASSQNYPPANAFDGVTGNLWQSSAAAPQWIAYDFGSGVAKDITEFVWSSTPTPGQQPSSMQLEWSDDGAAWNLAFAHTSVAAWSADEIRIFSSSAVTEPVKVRKLHGFVVLGPQVNSVAVQKIHGYAVLHDPAVAPVPSDRVPSRRILGMRIGGFG